MLRSAIRCLMLVSVFCVAFQAIHAQEVAKHPQKPILWKVSGKELKKPSWVFGTIHIASEANAELHPGVREALLASNVVYTEVPLDHLNLMRMRRQSMRTDGRTLTQSIGQELYRELDRELKQINPAMSPLLYDGFKTWVVMLTLPLIEYQMAGAKGVDRMVWDQAIAAKINTGGIEEVESQFEIFNGLTEPQQISLLTDTLMNMRQAREKGFDLLMDLDRAYHEGDHDSIRDAVKAYYSGLSLRGMGDVAADLKKKVLDDRDASISESIDKKLKAMPGQSHFFAFGAAHCGGANGVVSRLRKAGYELEIALGK